MKRTGNRSANPSGNGWHITDSFPFLYTEVHIHCCASVLFVTRDGKEGQQTGLGKPGRLRAEESLETELVRLPREVLSGRAVGPAAVFTSNR